MITCIINMISFLLFYSGVLRLSTGKHVYIIDSYLSFNLYLTILPNFIAKCIYCIYCVSVYDIWRLMLCYIITQI